MKKTVNLPPDSEPWRIRIADALNEKGITMLAASKAIGRGGTYVRDVLFRGNEPGADSLRELERFLGLDEPDPADSFMIREDVARHVLLHFINEDATEDFKTIDGAVDYFIRECKAFQRGSVGGEKREERNGTVHREISATKETS